MLEVRKASDRGHAQQGWLESYHSFSFADYNDPQFMGFRHLRVINEDRVAPGKGFGKHSHRDMEILSFVIEGALEHKDSMGNGSVIRPGELQLMRAGTGITHSEMNHSKSEAVHFLQIWLLPDRTGLPPAYDQREFPAEERRGRLRLIASPNGADGSVRVQQHVFVFATLLDSGQIVRHHLSPERYAWLQVVKGNLTVNGEPIAAGDGVAIAEESALELAASTDAEALLFDLS